MSVICRGSCGVGVGIRVGVGVGIIAVAVAAWLALVLPFPCGFCVGVVAGVFVEVCPLPPRCATICPATPLANAAKTMPENTTTMIAMIRNLKMGSPLLRGLAPP